ncbi:velvet factor protein [Stemphylium lycopersici]|uniref:Velvet factor protein n=1 Tax=Stemphylium lycopersici TaxID=183478 RepID=A0A364MY12_STELY|nr:velvet factor protein [Stemphylium lycopersici]RAR06960.1 velvet factor protein [Stemphylium lycopersici]
MAYPYNYAYQPQTYASSNYPPPTYQPTNYPSSSSYLYQQQVPSVPSIPPLSSNATRLSAASCLPAVRQQPKEALVMVKGKEKFRKPIDPPPVVQLKVDANTDPTEQFLQNPYIFMSVSLWKGDKDEPVNHTPSECLSGTLVSSLHRLKDVNNKDGGFFIFGDISVRIQGSYRLRFTLYEIHPVLFETPDDMGSYECLGHTLSEKFNVVLPKDFKGLEESTYLSRAFSDQGVRLRLRKEARGMMAQKRSFSEQEQPIAKRRREDSVEGTQYSVQPYVPPPPPTQTTNFSWNPYYANFMGPS